MAVRLAKDGWREVLGLTALLWALIVLALRLCPGHVLGPALAAAALAVWLWVLWFFRDPDRTAPEAPGLFISPADGHVSDITPLGSESELGCQGVRIGVFMNVFSVHVNRAPCQAAISRVTHKPGKFLDARNVHAIEANESVTVHMEYQSGGQSYPLVMRQVAGMIARRIVNHLRPGQSVQRGERIGMIKFGSRCELLLPADLAGDIRVRIGERVFAGRSVLAAHRAEGAL